MQELKPCFLMVMVIRDDYLFVFIVSAVVVVALVLLARL